MVVLTVLLSRNMSSYVKENLTVTVMLSDDLSAPQTRVLTRQLKSRPYVNRIDYISKEQAKRDGTEAMGADPSEFVGFNPFVATYEIKLRADYACRDSLLWIAKELKSRREISDVTYQQDLMDSVNRNLRKINICLLALAVLLTIVSFQLINSTVSLAVYAKRFNIYTMKLVGASWGFIRRPFMRQALVAGVVAAVVATAVVVGGIRALYNYEPGLQLVLTWRELALTAAAIMCFGILITLLCSRVAVNRYLRMTADELYKI